ncbi:hypothetical protein [Solirubrobacter soli]|uniref:hypothetical protein n=1 Tax=Solirubrobacter soli TaxID=363832 RepID=UPI000482A892|nr:hypothetical protein [Solirubrobacter soli]
MRRLAAGVGALVLAISLFLPWYRATGWFAYEGQPRVLPTFSAWEAFEYLDAVLLVLALAAVAAPRAAGALAGVIAAAQLLGDAHGVGAWLALVASIAILVAGGRPEWNRPPVIAGAGALLLFGALFAPWYGFAPPSRPSPAGYENGVLGLLNTLVGPDTLSLWRAFELLPVAITIAAALAFASKRAAAAGGVLAIVLVVYALLAPPENFSDLRFGAWLGLAGAVLAAVGAGSNRLRARPQVAP